MRRGLVLNSGSSWAAYQIGALEWLIEERGLSFDLCAGTGIGAMNAALVACGAFGPLEEFWREIGWRRLVRFNWRHPWSEAPFAGDPQARFLARHVDEAELERRGTTLVFSAVDLASGEEEVFTYPGDDLPLVDALRGAVAVPGCTKALARDGRVLVEGTVVDSFLLDRVVADHPVDEIYAVAAHPLGTGPAEKGPSEYDDWRGVMRRSLALNLSQDVRAATAAAEDVLAAARAHRRFRRAVADRVDEATEGDVRARAREALEEALAESEFPHRWETIPEVTRIYTSRPIDFPLWRFPSEGLDRLRETGRRDAAAALGDEGGGGR